MAGGRVWVDESSLLVVSDTPTSTSSLDESAQQYPEVFVACAVTRSPILGWVEEKPREAEQLFSLSNYPMTVSRDELSKEQQSNEMLNPQYEQVVDNLEIRNRAQGYFVKEGVLFRKWSPNCMGEYRSLYP